MNVKHIEETIDGHGGLSLYTQRYELDNPKAAVVILHGYCEHSQRYGHVVERLLDDGFNCYLLDHRGHGRSDGARAAVTRFEEYLQDLDLFMAFVKEHYPSGPMFLLGHSMGGLIAVNYMLSRKPEVTGVVLSSPYLGLKAEVPVWKKKLGTIVSNFLPKISLKSDLDPYLLSHDEAVVQEYIADPSVSKVVNTRWFTESTTSQQYCFDHASEWKWTTLFMHGGDDRIADPQSTKDFYQKTDPKNTELQILEGLYHEIFNEIDRKRVLDLTATWLLDHMPED